MTRQQNNPQMKELELLLQGEINHTGKLLAVLDKESEILVARDTSALEAVTAEKLELISQLKSIGEQRETLLSEMSVNPLIHDQQLSALWQELLSLAATCQEKNRINGSVIEVGYRQSQQALDILHGTSARPELYDQAGQTTRSSKSSPLARV